MNEAGSTAASSTEDCPSLVLAGSLDDAEATVDAVRSFMADVGIGTAMPPDVPKLITAMRQAVRSGRQTEAGALAIVEMRLMVIVDQELKRRGDARRVVRAMDEAPTRRWLLVSPEQRAALVARGKKLAPAGPPPGLWWNFASLPFAIASVVLGGMAVKRGDSDLYVAAGVAYAVWFGARILVRKKIASLAASS